LKDNKMAKKYKTVREALDAADAALKEAEKIAIA